MHRQTADRWGCLNVIIVNGIEKHPYSTNVSTVCLLLYDIAVPIYQILYCLETTIYYAAKDDHWNED